MGVSNYLPSSRLIQPGVCTSSTRPATPFEGQAIFETDTDRMLIWNGTTWVIPNAPAQNPTGMELIKTQTIGTSVSSVNINNAFTDDYANYRIIIDGGTQTAVSPVISLQLTAAGTASTVNYYATFIFTFYSGTTMNILNTNNGANIPYVAMSLNDGLSGGFDVYQPKVAGKTSFGGFTNREDISGYVSGFHSPTTSYDGFVLILNSGTMTGGTIRVYGYRN
jgi:hypothetical protein